MKHQITEQGDALRAARLDLAAQLECLGDAAREGSMRAACIDTGGTLIYPAEASTWGPHGAEVDCLGVYFCGDDMSEAIRGWIAAVIRMERMRLEDAA